MKPVFTEVPENLENEKNRKNLIFSAISLSKVLLIFTIFIEMWKK